MMVSYLYQLKFDTPVHFGTIEAGGGLESAVYTYESDRLFSSLCCELAENGDSNKILDLVGAADSGKLILSDLFPFAKVDGDCRLYIPKPVLPPIERNESDEIRSYTEACKASVAKKTNKKLEFIRVSKVDEYIQSLKSNRAFTEDDDFGASWLTEQVSCRGDKPLPYYVGTFVFAKNTGLYGIIQGEERIVQRSLALLEQLGLSGIGGKRSSGYGKFRFHGTPFVLDEELLYDDAIELKRRMDDKTAQWHMNMSLLIPHVGDIADVKQGFYSLKKRSGFVSSLSSGYVHKRRDLYGIASGSCFKNQPAGKVAAMRTDTGHDVYRNGKALYLGVNA